MYVCVCVVGGGGGGGLHCVHVYVAAKSRILMSYN